MRLFSLLLLVLSVLVVLGAPMSFAASADPPAKSAQLAISSAPPQRTARANKRWSKRKKIGAAIVLGCIVATAIAVPVAVSVHHQQEIHQQARARNLMELVIRNQEIVASRQEQAVRSLLTGGPIIAPSLTVAQRAALQTDLAQLKQAESTLNQAYDDVLLHKPLRMIIGLDEHADAILKSSNVYAAQYDGFADFPQYPINVLSDLNAIAGTTYYTLPTPELPLLNPIRPVPTVPLLP